MQILVNTLGKKCLNAILVNTLGKKCLNAVLSNLCRATSREVLFLGGYFQIKFQWSMSLRGGDIFAGRES